MKIKDHFLSGFIPGLLAPPIGFCLYFFIFFGYMTLQGFIEHVINAGLALSVLSLGAILNLGLFFLFYQFNKDRAAKGVIAAIFVYAFFVMYYRVLA